MLSIEIHQVEIERNNEVVRCSGIKRDIEIGIAHQFGTNCAEASLSFIYSNKFIIRRQYTRHHLSQLIAHIVNKDT